jgi:lipoprotein-releasing system ATP-binding protein
LTTNSIKNDNDKLLVLKDITKSYKDKSYTINVLDSLNLTVEKGDMVAITGTSGSGKSTLLHIIGLLDTPDSGKIIFDNVEKSVYNSDLEMFRNKHIGFVFQFHYLLADFTAIENIALPAVIGGLSWKKAKEKAISLCDKLGISGRYSHYPNQLSGGEQQRVSIARALINQPEIIIADEPTGNLDINHSEEIINIFEQINYENKQTIILATHDIQIAQRMKNHFTIEKSKLVKN